MGVVLLASGVTPSAVACRGCGRGLAKSAHYQVVPLLAKAKIPNFAAKFGFCRPSPALYTRALDECEDYAALRNVASQLQAVAIGQLIFATLPEAITMQWRDDPVDSRKSDQENLDVLGLAYRPETYAALMKKVQGLMITRGKESTN